MSARNSGADRQRAGYAALLDAIWPDPGDERAWMDWALCAQTDPEVFHPGRGGSPKKARKVCLSCPVVLACDAWITRIEADMPNEDIRGIYAAKTAKDRLRERQRARRAAREGGAAA